MPQLTIESRCELCWRYVESPCLAGGCGLHTRDASECTELHSLPFGPRGMPIRSDGYKEEMEPALLTTFAAGYYAKLLETRNQ